MIPNIFVSSTVSDLHYRREALRETIQDLAYAPIMSDFGEVGYLHPATAAASCYRSVEQCQMVIVIVGRRYGSIGDDGVSVTHREFRTAQERRIPIISFVEPQVLTYKEVYDSSPENAMWDAFPHMDHPRRTFSLVDEIKASPAYNAIIPFHDVTDAKRKLKLQIADFVGSNLQESIQPYRYDLRELLVELKTLRSQLAGTGRTRTKSNAENRKTLTTLRFLLDERHADYRKFVEGLRGDIDAALPEVIRAKTLDDLLSGLKYTIQFHDDAAFQGFMQENWQQLQLKSATYGQHGGFATTRNRVVHITQGQFDRFADSQQALRARLNSDEGA